MFLNIPFNAEQVRSINTFQRMSEVIPPMTCKCGGQLFARDEGLICKECYSTSETVPLYIANWSWNRFRKKEELAEAEDGITEPDSSGW